MQTIIPEMDAMQVIIPGVDANNNNNNNNNVVADHVNCLEEFDNTNSKGDADIGGNDTYAEIGDADNSNSTGVADVGGGSDSTGMAPEYCVHMGLGISYSSMTTLEYGKVIPKVTPSASCKELVADFLSKPLQASLFRVHQNSIMGLTEVGKFH